MIEELLRANAESSEIDTDLVWALKPVIFGARLVQELLDRVPRWSAGVKTIALIDILSDDDFDKLVRLLSRMIDPSAPIFASAYKIALKAVRFCHTESQMGSLAFRFPWSSWSLGSETALEFFCEHNPGETFSPLVTSVGALIDRVRIRFGVELTRFKMLLGGLMLEALQANMPETSSPTSVLDILARSAGMLESISLEPLFGLLTAVRTSSPPLELLSEEEEEGGKSRLGAVLGIANSASNILVKALREVHKPFSVPIKLAEQFDEIFRRIGGRVVLMLRGFDEAIQTALYAYKEPEISHYLLKFLRRDYVGEFFLHGKLFIDTVNQKFNLEPPIQYDWQESALYKLGLPIVTNDATLPKKALGQHGASTTAPENKLSDASARMVGRKTTRKHPIPDDKTPRSKLPKRDERDFDVHARQG